MILGAIHAVDFALETFGIAGTSATSLAISLAIVLASVMENLLTCTWLPPMILVAGVVSIVGAGAIIVWSDRGDGSSNASGRPGGWGVGAGGLPPRVRTSSKTTRPGPGARRATRRKAPCSQKSSHRA